jgi:uncharacterized Zn-binding protein involved in type VI secretion
MANPVVEVGATIMCPHGGSASIVPGNSRVMLDGKPAALLTDPCMIAGCPFALPSGSPAPCLTVQWMTSATRVTVNGTPVLLSNSQGLCMGGGPPAPPTIAATQVRVKAT